MNPTVIILRGIPGSGKSTFVAKEYPNAIVCSADDFFLKRTYHFSLLNQAHDECRKKFKKALIEKKPLIAVDNTNIKIWELIPYVNMAINHDYNILIYEFECSTDIAATRNTHNVPFNTVEKMNNNFESLPDWIRRNPCVEVKYASY